MSGQQRVLDESLKEAIKEKISIRAKEFAIDLDEFDRKLTAVMETCTKEAISVSSLVFLFFSSLYFN